MTSHIKVGRGVQDSQKMRDVINERSLFVTDLLNEADINLLQLLNN